MGSTAHVLVHGPGAGALVDLARARIAELGSRWSRFREDSEISRVNAQAGTPTFVSADTLILIARAVAGWRRTGGLFDPTVHAAMLAHGYDRDFALLHSREALPRPEAARHQPAPGCTGITLDLAASRVVIPPRTALDPGGIGKGLAADLVSAQLRQHGATGVLVNIGGDVRVRGRAATGEGWVVSVADPFSADGELLRLGLPAGAVATSTTLHRRWMSAGRPVHHIMDPRSGRPSAGDLVSATVVTRSAWWAEVLTKAVLLAGTTTIAPPPAEVAAVTAGGRHRVTDRLRPALR
ncbi:FAD:protein FMN transferase [Amycolatopsis sp. K13G38]|uniref:FAD:protein FMN transferase n=1 Tax=Amycolatopsis acididurans TaxID=2724524 RepID=A0ABX1IXZ7_9PSEU|nr:FAD:protein FMN transferase [Amycolatopsis acididurans]NKQ52362.1 FAD:protein FMN transferase [Amycolatopsis acididurans]